MKKVLALLFVTFVLVLSLFYVIDNGKTYEVVLREDGFYPKEITIEKGDIIVFSTERGERFWPASDLHPLHNIYSEFDPKKSIDPESSWSFRFKKVGEWKFHDHLFPYYRGTVNVVGKLDKKIQPVPNDISESEIVDKIEELFLKNSPEVAYKKMIDLFSASDQSVSHLAAHVFGEKLYERASDKGIFVCNEAFGFGCYHGFISKAVAEGGEDAAIEIDRRCVEKYGVLGLGCPHGIGHGLGEYFGNKRINEQLAICRKLSWTGSLLGCSGGVFMEHNLPSRLGDGVDELIEEKENQPFYPCTEVSDYLSSCYFELPQRWEARSGMSAEEAGKLCGQVVDVENKRFCFMGLGYAKATTNQNADMAKQWCQKVSTKKQEVAICYSGIAWSMFSDPITRDYVPDLCRSLSGEYEKVCLDYLVVLKQSK